MRDRTHASDPDVREPRISRWREAMRRQLPGGLTLGGYLVVEAVCTGALLTLILVAAL